MLFSLHYIRFFIISDISKEVEKLILQAYVYDNLKRCIYFRFDF